jgi:hypothetical protein
MYAVVEFTDYAPALLRAIAALMESKQALTVELF